MKVLIEKMLENRSTRDVFLFQIFCASCGSESVGKRVRFSKAGIIPQTQGKQVIYDAVYEQEFRDARQAAIREAAENLNFCPICKRLVCNRCFLICDDLDMCRQCASDLEEEGSPVFSEVIEIVL